MCEYVNATVFRFQYFSHKNTEEEGVRRSLCDMTLLIFHLILSSFTFDGIDIALAAKILNWNLKRYPNGAWLQHRSSALN